MRRSIGVVGLGYVGLPVAISFGEVYDVVGFDTCNNRINTLRQYIDHTGEVSTNELMNTKVNFTTDPTRLQQCEFIIIAVPTPIDDAKQPDLTALILASETVGRNMKAGSIVVYESTVYPGATEEVCVPVLEKLSGLKAGEDFFVGYSPERINPGDKEHTFKKNVKVVSGDCEYSTSIIADIYGSVVSAGIFRASSIKVAEAAKVIENTQRDLNIALMNELAIIFDHLGIDTQEVLEAAGTKWNFLTFTPGLVGGHCIGVDPYYLTHKAESVGYHSEVILAGRRINDGIGRYIANSLVKQMIIQNIPIQGAKVTILGLTFKENVSDIRNSKVIDIIRELEEFGVQVQVTDPIANSEESQRVYGKYMLAFEQLEPASAVILAVSHREYLNMGWNGITPLLTDSRGIIVDVKSVLPKADCPEGITLWRL